VAAPPVPVAKPEGGPAIETTHKIIAVASSTGGTEALKVFLQGVPRECPGILIVQHMPPVFTRAYATNLRNLTGLDVREAKNGDRVLPGSVLLAPGDFHMELARSGSFYSVRLHQEGLLHGLRPAADYLFKSVAANAGTNAVGVVLTGMGVDGAQGLLEMRNAGAFTVAQDEETSAVFGMPREAIRLQAAREVLPLDRIAQAVLRYFSVELGSTTKAA
jgi:two-component system chemotaxis response regulator CheB